MGKHYLFIYGTLKRGKRNNPVMSDSRFVCEAVTKPMYKLYFGVFPYLVPSEHGVQVKGEIWEVTTEMLNRLDRFEGHPTLYKRDTVCLENFDNKVEAYFYQREIKPEYKDCGIEWDLEQ